MATTVQVDEQNTEISLPSGRDKVSASSHKIPNDGLIFHQVQRVHNNSKYNKQPQRRVDACSQKQQQRQQKLTKAKLLTTTTRVDGRACKRTSTSSTSSSSTSNCGRVASLACLLSFRSASGRKQLAAGNKFALAMNSFLCKRGWSVSSRSRRSIDNGEGNRRLGGAALNQVERPLALACIVVIILLILSCCLFVDKADAKKDKGGKGKGKGNMVIMMGGGYGGGGGGYGGGGGGGYGGGGGGGGYGAMPISMVPMMPCMMAGYGGGGGGGGYSMGGGGYERRRRRRKR